MSLTLRQPGLRLLHLPSVDSTNRVASEAARRGDPAGLVVVADVQTAGRGRQGRSWTAPPGCSLTVSYLRRPRVAPTDAWAWTLIAGLAAHAVADGAWLKWPNDLMIGERKAAGVLCELVTRGAQLDAVIVGIGLNLCAPPGGWPPEIADRAIDLQTLDPALDRQAALDRLSAALLDLEDALARRGTVPLLTAAEHAMAPMIGRQVRVDGRSARVLGIGHNGALRLHDGRAEFSVLAGDVHLGG